MADPQPSGGTRGSARADSGRVIRGRPRVGVIGAVIIGLLFALLMTPVALAHSWWADDDAFEAGRSAPMTLRASLFHSTEAGDRQIRQGAVVVRRGDLLDPQDAELARDLRSQEPRGATAYLAYFLGFALMGTLFSAHLRRSHRGKLLRAQAVTLGVLTVAAVAIKLLLLLTPMSVLAVPVAALALLAARTIDMSAALATALVAALTIGGLAPFDPGTMTILAVQASAAVLVFGDRPSHWMARTAIAGVVAGIAGAVCYGVFHVLSWDVLPTAELSRPLDSAWLACLLAGMLSGVLALLLGAAYQVALGEITLGKLVELEDLGNPLLKQIADNAPGTWQHTLAMANMAEMAANAIGASGRLVRVGAYYHDLGKSLQPKYFIENLKAGETSPHDKLDPEVSADAIFAHVTEGVRLGRKSGLPERVIDFMHMHHGNGLLEYFWVKCKECGNPKGLEESDFRYPGIIPQTRETAILAIVDAVEAASRTLRQPDERSIRNLVQRIVYGKLHLGQLDESGLTMSELRRLSDALIHTLTHAHHGRIEYPWQREEAGDADGGTSTTARERPRPPTETSATSQLMREPRLDSLDQPRPMGPPPASRRASDTGHPDLDPRSAVAHAPTERHVERSTTERDAEVAVPEPAADERPRTDPGDETRSLRRGDSQPTLEVLPESDPRALRARQEEHSLLRSQSSVADWQAALESAVREDPQASSTLPMQPRAGHDPTQADAGDDLEPGRVVVGAPPATHPERGRRSTNPFGGVATTERSPPVPHPFGAPPKADEATRQVRISPPLEATRPDQRQTAERPIQLPPEAMRDPNDET